MKKIIIKCKECRKKTAVGSGAGKYCQECRRIVLKRQNRENSRKEKVERKRKLNLRCQECNVSLTDFLYARKYCPKCAQEAYKQLNKDSNAEHYQKNKERVKSYNREYYKRPGVKEKHRIQAKESARRITMKKKMVKLIN